MMVRYLQLVVMVVHLMGCASGSITARMKHWPVNLLKSKRSSTSTSSVSSIPPALGIKGGSSCCDKKDLDGSGKKGTL